MPELKTKQIAPEHLELVLEGDYLGFDRQREIDGFFAQISQKNLKKITVDSKNLGRWDSTLVVIFYNLIKLADKNSFKIDLKSLPEGLKSLLNLAFAVDRQPPLTAPTPEPFLARWGQHTLNLVASFKRGCTFLGEALHSLGRFLKGSAIMRPVDFLFALEDCGYKAFPIVALISAMVGLIVGFVGAVQLQLFGAQIFVASLVAIAMVRVMGALMTGIIMAGRTGASYAATIGAMQVNEEVDALKTMGIPAHDFLLLPRMLALILMMPLLTVFADIMGMIGGALVGIYVLGLAPGEYWSYTLKALGAKNFLVGIFHGFTFGWVIALCGCYFGINCGRDADSVGKATTNAVVYSIIWIVITTSIITIICNWLGI